MKSNLFTAETAGSQFVSCDRVGKHQNRRPSPSDRARARLLAMETQDLTVLAVSGRGGMAAGEV